MSRPADQGLVSEPATRPIIPIGFIYLLEYQSHDSQGGWWPHAQVFTDDAKAEREARRVGRGGRVRNVQLRAIPRGNGEVIYQRLEEHGGRW